MAQTNQRQAPVIYEPACQVNPPPAPPVGYPLGYYVAPPPIGYPSKDDSGYPSQHTPETKMRGTIEFQCCCFSWSRSS
ncbi:hypothetical protein OIU77_015468 [Salix suchowensis]|uniref:Uncharacterized protein n=1 Tax=Salix suchowensis TaxID=1278906 RepID=A0ABQ8ZHC0_9ROSI|nr:hypothetical protein OIU77_015468 [Salix suchowensis]